MDIILIDRKLGDLSPGTLFAFTPGSKPDHIRLAGSQANTCNPYFASFEEGRLTADKPSETPVYTEREKVPFGQLQPGAPFICSGVYCLKAECRFVGGGPSGHRRSYSAMTLEGNFVDVENNTLVTPIAGPLQVTY